MTATTPETEMIPLPDPVPGKVVSFADERLLRDIRQDFIFENFEPQDIEGGSEIYDPREFARMRVQLADALMRIAKLEAQIHG